MEKNRSRKHKFTLYLDNDEDRILDAKYKMSNMRSKFTFLRHMIVYGAVYDVDYAYLREYNYLLGKIGRNLNQTAKRINETRSVYQIDMDAVKAEMDRLWNVQIDLKYGPDMLKKIEQEEMRDIHCKEAEYVL